MASKKGLHLSPKSSLLRREDLKPGRLGLYSQTSSRPYGVARDCLRNRIAIIRRNRVAIVYAPRAQLRKGFIDHRLAQINTDLEPKALIRMISD